MEAVTDVVRQIRLWDLGGIIIIDFIDMERFEHRDQVFKALRRVLADDKARTNVLEISELGLVEMTRKRVRQSLQSLFCAPCPTCKGSGVVQSDATLAAEIFRKIHAGGPARVALTAGKQGDKTARQRGWVKPKRAPRKAKRAVEPRPAGRARRGARSTPAATQPSLFPES